MHQPSRCLTDAEHVPAAKDISRDEKSTVGYITNDKYVSTVKTSRRTSKINQPSRFSQPVPLTDGGKTYNDRQDISRTTNMYISTVTVKIPHGREKYLDRPETSFLRTREKHQQSKYLTKVTIISRARKMHQRSSSCTVSTVSISPVARARGRERDGRSEAPEVEIEPVDLPSAAPHQHIAYQKTTKSAFFP